MVFGFKYPRSVRAWMRKARKELDRSGPLIEDPNLPARLKLLSKGRMNELGRLVQNHRRYKELWVKEVSEYSAAFKRLTSSDSSTSERLEDLDKLANASHDGGAMQSLRGESFYQSREDLWQQLIELSQEVAKRAENGSEEDFLQLRRYLQDVSMVWPYAGYPTNYPELVDLYVENPRYQDYLVRAVEPMSQARYSNSLNFLKLFIERSGGSEAKVGTPPMRTHAGQYFEELDRYLMYDIQDRIRTLSKGEDNQ